VDTVIVAVDGRAFGSRRGIARYAREMVRALASSGRGMEIRARAAGRQNDAAIPGVVLTGPRMPSRLVHGTAAVLGRPTVAGAAGGDIAWLPAPAPGAPGRPYVLTVHDLSWIERPGDFTRYERIWHRLMRFESLLRNAGAVVCDTASGAADLGDRFGVEAAVVEPGVSIPGEVEPARRKRPYYLYVGALEPRKGVDVLSEAWRRASPDADLLIVGSGRSRPSEGEVLGPVPDEELHRLYAGAEAVVLPSLLEGYGFPPREAAAHGVPSIVSDLPSLRVPGTLRFHPGDADALAGALRTLPAERTRLVAELQPPRSWATAASELADVFDRVVR
jgi:glycosyltransferase involved in cell wall biosynthesis